MLAGRYVLDELLGTSPTGMVWTATDVLLRRTVTIKLIHPRLADDPGFVHALVEQTRRLAGLADPRLARLLDSGHDDGVMFIVREHLEGVGLRTLVSERGPLSPAQAASNVSQALEGLAAAHRAGVLHLALDADDVIVSDDGQIGVTDLGLGAAIASSRRDHAVELLGSDRLAPEWATPRADLDARADVFAAGALLFELLTGEPPRGRRSARAIRGTVPRGLDRVVRSALDPDPDRRPLDASAFAAELRSDDPTDDVVVIPEADGNGGGPLLWLGVPLLIAGAAAAIIAIGLWAGTLGAERSSTTEPTERSASQADIAPRAIRPVSATAIDPFGDGIESSANTSWAIDGDRATSWASENYFDGTLDKPGIGLVLDLGSSRRTLGLRLWTGNPGFAFQVGVGDDPEALMGLLDEAVVASPSTWVQLDGRGRYVLVWITSVVPTDDGHRAEVEEIRVVVPVLEAVDA